MTLKSLKSIGPFSLLLLLFVFIWALMGMELFAYKVVFDENENIIDNPIEAYTMLEKGEISAIDYPRENFNNIKSALVSVFILIYGEDWNAIMNLYVRAYEKNDDFKTWIPKTYCLIGLVIGNMTILALFTGILLQSFIESNN